MRSRKTHKLFAFLVVSLLGSSVTASAYTSIWPQASTANASMANPNASMANRGDLRGVRNSLPSLPRGRRTVLGGRIYDVDPVSDQFKLKIPGGQRITILYDERTHFYQDGSERSVLDLHAASHASIETTLDGSKIFAVSVHLLSKAPEGEIRGQVLSYSASTGMLKVRSSVSNGAITLKVSTQVAIVATGQIKAPVASDGLVPGALVDVAFQPGNRGQGIATHIDLLAYPGAQIVFQGKVSFLNVHGGWLTVEDVADHQSYQISFNPQQFSNAKSLHEGANVKVVAEFNGSQYVAQSISPL